MKAKYPFDWPFGVLTPRQQLELLRRENESAKAEGASERSKALDERQARLRLKREKGGRY